MEGLLLDTNYTKGDTIHLTVYSDLHIGSVSCARELLKEHMARRAALPNAKFALIGDFGDWIVSKSDPRYQPGQTTAGNRADIVNATYDEAVELLGPYKWEFVGIGNHETSLLSHGGLDILKFLLRDLGDPAYGRYSGFARFRFNDPVGNGAAATWNLLYHHGFSGGRGRSTPPPSVSHWIAGHDGFDAVVYGHNHKLAVNWLTRTYMSNKGKIKHRDIPVVNTGTHSREETQGANPGYGEIKGYPPVTIGAPLFKLTPDRATGRVKCSVETGDC